MEELGELRLCQPGRKHCHEGPGQQGLLLSNPPHLPWELEANGRRHWLRLLLAARGSCYVTLQRQGQIEKRCLCCGCRLPGSFCWSLNNKLISITLFTDPAISLYIFQTSRGRKRSLYNTEKEERVDFCQLKVAQLFSAALFSLLLLPWTTWRLWREQTAQCETWGFSERLRNLKGVMRSRERGFELQTVALALQL